MYSKITTESNAIASFFGYAGFVSYLSFLFFTVLVCFVLPIIQNTSMQSTAFYLCAGIHKQPNSIEI